MNSRADLPSPRRLWRLYRLIVMVSLLAGVLALGVEWKHVTDATRLELNYTNDLIANSQRVVMRKYEALLELLGERLLELKGLEGDVRAREWVDELLQRNPELAGFGLADPAGNLVLTSFNIDPERLPNLRENPHTSDSFLQTLRSRRMIIGRTYYMPGLREWVIPLRHALRDGDGRVRAVMTTGLRLDSSAGIWSQRTVPRHILFAVVREDFYRQYASYVPAEEWARYYNQPVPEHMIRRYQDALQDQAEGSLSKLAEQRLHLSLYAPDFHDRLLLVSVGFEPQYRNFVATGIPVISLVQRFAPIAVLTVSLLLLLNGVLYVVFRSQVRQQAAAERRLAHLASHDQLTGLPNRRYLNERFVLWRNKGHSRLCLLFIDLDNFKAINDLYGHTVGDAILQVVANRLSEVFAGDVCIRQGGDEFIVLVQGRFTGRLEQRSQRFLAELRHPIHHEDLQFSVRASIGVAQSPEDGSTLEELLRKADMAMYEAKRLHCGIHPYADALERSRERIGRIERALAQAFEQDELSLAYQPQVDVRSGGIIGVEVLLRWHSGTLGQVSPAEFIPVAESMGIMPELGRFVVTRALRETPLFLEGRQAGVPPMRLALNASVSQLFDAGFVMHLLESNRRWQAAERTLVIEITESLFIEDVEQARELLESLRRDGLEISLDDFGTGYSSLSLLSKLPISELKIDKGFVKDILSDQRDHQLIRSIIGLGSSLGIPVLAEGVESAEQARLLETAGCARFQGYWIARPMSATELVDFLRQWQGLKPVRLAGPPES